jgi:hypothetical protein
MRSRVIEEASNFEGGFMMVDCPIRLMPTAFWKRSTDATLPISKSHPMNRRMDGFREACACNMHAVQYWKTKILYLMFSNRGK